ncbi:MAG TPA: 4Fe-4S binding protein [Bacteroidales bacterium]|nr:4Fe-4S binding protein [Bacteroidales bacterium]
MSIDRRTFLKAMGATAVALSVGKQASATQTDDQKPEFMAILYDSTKCVACLGCEYDCAEAHGNPDYEIPIDPPLRKTDDTQRTVVNKYETSKGLVPRKIQCMHCNQPACDAACLTQAMHKCPDGPVIWREDKCMGCRYCMISCPFDIPKFEYGSTNPEIVKCDMCIDRIREGETPACAYNCPEEALVYGKRSDLIREARRRIVEEPDRYVDHIYGEHEAGGTSWLYLSPVPFDEIGFNTKIQKSSYPALTKGFISSIAPVDILLPAVLLGIYEATKTKNTKEEEQ